MSQDHADYRIQRQMDAFEKEERAAKLLELSQQLTAARRHTPPAPEDAGRWIFVVDQDTGKPSWYPKDLIDAEQDLRFPA